MRAVASIGGSRGAQKGHASGDLAVTRVPSGLLVITVNHRPRTWSGEWTGDTMALYLTGEQAIELGKELIKQGGEKP